MINKLKPKSEFSRNVLTLMTGTSIAQAIPIAISPILTRIYTPEDFGVFALYMSIVSIIAVIATGRYELAIMLPKKDEDAANIVAFSIGIAFIISIISFFIVFLFNEDITNFIGNKEISNWLYLIPVSVLLMGIYQSFSYWSNRKKKYRIIVTSKITQSVTASTTHIGMGLVSYGSMGLILGGIIGNTLAVISLGKMNYNEDKKFVERINTLKMFALMKKYIDFPKINLPHSFLNVLSSNFPLIIISFFFQNASAGFYSLANRVVLSPLNIVSSSYSQVFLQKISELSNTPNEQNQAISFVKKTIFKLLVYSLPLFFLFFIFSPKIFSIIFGENWEIAGLYTQILIPMFYFRFTGSIVSSVVIVYNKQKKALKIEIINTLARIISLAIGGIIDNIFLGLILFSTSSSIITIYRLFWYIDILNKEKNAI